MADKLCLFVKPRVKRVFLDSSAFLRLMDVNAPSEDKRLTAQAYEKYFTDFLPSCDCLAYINPLVLLEITNVIDRAAFEGNWSGAHIELQDIRDEMAKHVDVYPREWKGVTDDRKRLSTAVLGIITKSEKILCPRFPGDTARLDFCKDIQKDILSLSKKGLTPAEEEPE